MRLKKTEFVSYMSTNSTKKELIFLYKLLHYRNIEIDDAEEMIVNTFTKDELSENIYRIMHQRSFWNVSTVINCVTMLINTRMWLHSFSKIRQAYKTGNQSKLSFLDGAGFVLHSLFVVNDLNSLKSRRATVKRQKNANQLYLDYHLQNTQNRHAPISTDATKKSNKRTPVNPKPSPTKKKTTRAKSNRPPLPKSKSKSKSNPKPLPKSKSNKAIRKQSNKNKNKIKP